MQLPELALPCRGLYGARGDNGFVVLLQFIDPNGVWELTKMWEPYKYLCLMAFLLSLFVSFMRSSFPMLRAVLGWRPFAVLGGFSYSMYIVHAPIVQMFHQYVLPPLHLSEYAAEATVFLVMVPAIIAIAYGFYLLFERQPLLVPCALWRALQGLGMGIKMLADRVDQSFEDGIFSREELLGLSQFAEEVSMDEEDHRESRERSYDNPPVPMVGID